MKGVTRKSKGLTRKLARIAIMPSKCVLFQRIPDAKNYAT